MTKLYAHQTIPDGAFAHYYLPNKGKVEAIGIEDDWNGLLYLNKIISNGEGAVVVPTLNLMFDTEIEKQKWLADKTSRDGYYLFCHRGEDIWLPCLDAKGNKSYVLDCCLGIAWSEEPFDGVKYSEEMKR